MVLNFKINGFHCDACVRLATMKLKKIDGVEDVLVTPEGQAALSTNRNISLAEIVPIIESIGYTVEV